MFCPPEDFEEDRKLIKEEPSYYTLTFWKSCSDASPKKFMDWYEKNESLISAVVLNIIRDYIWTWWSYELYNIRFNQTTDANYDTNSQWAGQQLWSTVGMLGGCAILNLVSCFRNNKLNRFKDSLIFTAAASTAVYTWDIGQQVGIWIGQNMLGFSPNIAAYFSSIFTGGAEGPTQNFVIKLGNLFSKSKERQKFLDDPCLYLKNNGIDSVYSATIGAIPGAVWQLVFAACVIYGIDVATTSALVAASVAIGNIATAKIQESMYKNCINAPADEDSNLQIQV